MTTLKIALDWTPNTNHIGLFIAQKLGFYTDLNIQVDIINPLDDQYIKTPGKKLSIGEVDFAIAPFETAISLNNKEKPFDAIAIYAILQEDLSSIVTLQSSNLNQPKLLDGKIYASYKARYEDHIVKQMIKNDGGYGQINITYPAKLGIWNTLLSGKADATWIFNNWEGVEAEAKGIKLNHFALHNFDIPYGYSPVILTQHSKIDPNGEAYANFISATRQGYLYAAHNQTEAAAILYPYLTDYDKENIDLARSIALTVPHFGVEETCGHMKVDRVNAFLIWLEKHGLEGAQILDQFLFTNALLY